MSIACGSSQARDWTHITATTWATAVTTPDPSPTAPQGNSSKFRFLKSPHEYSDHSVIYCYLYYYISCHLLHNKWLHNLVASKYVFLGVPVVVQWVKNLTAAAQVTAEVQVDPPAWHSGLKDPALWQLWLGFNPRLGSFHMLWVWPLKNRVFFHSFYGAGI